MRKECSSCKQTKEESEFQKDSNTHDGLRYECKFCRNAKLKKEGKNDQFDIGYFEPNKKKCKMCQEVRSLDNFYKKGSGRYESFCKKCKTISKMINNS